jgi:hypothetical protein
VPFFISDFINLGLLPPRFCHVAKDLLILLIFSKSQLFVSLILCIVCLVSISLILALIFVISLCLLVLDLVCSCFLGT